eukprot:m.217618 g.217618  ORF g.217618 m.217618 type:complete len:492 (+) comp33239_c0_seq2:169-1644(+)
MKGDDKVPFGLKVETRPDGTTEVECCELAAPNPSLTFAKLCVVLLNDKLERLIISSAYVFNSELFREGEGHVGLEFGPMLTQVLSQRKPTLPPYSVTLKGETASHIALAIELLKLDQVCFLQALWGGKDPELPIFSMKLFPLFCDAIKTTSALRSLSVFYWGLPNSKNSTLVGLFRSAIFQNKSLVAVNFMYGGYVSNSTLSEGDPAAFPLSSEELTILQKFLKRNSDLQDMNTAVASSMLPGKWDTTKCPSTIATAVFAAKCTVSSTLRHPSGDRCFCCACVAKRKDKPFYSRGKPPEKFVIPEGWTRIGVGPTHGVAFAETHHVFEDWHVCYHGTTLNAATNIMKNGLMLLKPGDIALGGDTLGIAKGHIAKPFNRLNKFTKKEELFDPNQIFLSPSPRYSAHPAYAEMYVCQNPLNSQEQLGVHFMFQCRVRPGAYSTGQETVGALASKTTLDPHVSNSQLEWYTKESIGVVITGLLIRVRELKPTPK